MPLNIIETTLEKVKPEHHALYVAKDGKYHLDLRDLGLYVENQLKPLKSDLAITRESERKLLLENGLGAALRQANILPNYEDLIIANFGDRVALETVDNKRVIRILAADGGTPMVGSGPKGLATLGDLAAEAAKTFPSTFSRAGGGTPSAPGNNNTGGSGQKTLTRAAFDALSPIERARKMSDGFTIVDPPVEKPVARKLGDKEMLRSTFDTLHPIARATKMKEGFKIVD